MTDVQAASGSSGTFPPSPAAPRRTGCTVLAIGLAAACALALAPAARAGDPGPTTLARLALPGAGPYYTLRLPIALQSAAARADLDDLRVRNAAGETMAFAWVVPATGETPVQQQVAATLYKVPPPPATTGSGAAGGTPAAAWIVDTRDARSDLDRLDLVLAPGAQGVFALSVEASDDLQDWRLVQPRAALVRLRPQAAGVPARNPECNMRALVVALESGLAPIRRAPE